MERTAAHSPDEFPTAEVHRSLDHAGPRPVTCGGDHAKADSHYADTVVVHASPADGRT
ncbi:hypothetical protein [Streptomyces sp. NPDC047973]|uniref:hypothetical protein n=1 Tax=Streptomyces sp. NPDC047973 TaxID=3155383 RepID=UPI00342D2F60